MAINYENQSELKDLIDETLIEENVQRKADSFKEFEVYSDRLWRYVFTYLQGQFDLDTVKEMPLVASLNLARRVVNQEATLYRTAPDREWSEDFSDDQKETLDLIYSDGNFNAKLNKSNAFYKLQANQNILQVKPMRGQLKMRPMLRHHLDVVPDADWPEMAEAYIVNGFDRTRFVSGYTDNYSPSGHHGPENKYFQDLKNQKIADKDDWRRKARFEWWTKDYHFVTDGYGNIQPDENGEFKIESPIPGVLPFVDVSATKDFEFWLRSGKSVVDFTVEFNGYWSSIMDVIRMQGFSIPVFKGPDDVLPKEIKIGTGKAIRLPIDPNNPVETDFKFIAPNPDISSSLTAGEQLLAMFLSSRGLDPKIINGKGEGTQYSSGFERMLALMDKFEASKQDVDTYKWAENRLVKVVGAWHNALKPTDQLEDKYKTEDFDVEEMSVSLNYAKPEALKTEGEVLDSLERRLELGLIDEADAMAEYYSISREQAEERMANMGPENGDIRPQA